MMEPHGRIVLIKLLAQVKAVLIIRGGGHLGAWARRHGNLSLCIYLFPQISNVYIISLVQKHILFLYIGQKNIFQT